MYSITNLPTSVEIGLTGEHAFRTIEIDLSPWMEVMPNGVPSIVHIRPGEGDEDAYIVATTFDSDTNVLSWTVSRSDLGTAEGVGTAQVWLEETANYTLAKRGLSAMFATIIRDSIGDDSATVPAAQVPFVQQMTQLKTNTVAAALRAEAAQAAAESAASGVSEYTSQAEQHAQNADSYSNISEAYAKGTVDGVAVGEGETGYQDSSKYYKEQAEAAATAAAGSATTASQQALAAGNSMSQAYQYSQAAATSAQNASTSATNALESAGVAEAAKGVAQTSASEAAASAAQAAQTVAGIEAAGDAEVLKVTAQGAAERAAIVAEGEDVLDSIPADYSALTEEVGNLSSAFDYNLIADSIADNVVYLPGTDGDITLLSNHGSGGGKRSTNLILLNATTTSNYTRFFLTGNNDNGAHPYSTSVPTYERVPSWYISGGIPNFVSGHRYYVSIELLSGTSSPTTAGNNPFLTFRDTAGTLNVSKANGDFFDCELIPDMVCFATQPGTYTNCVFSIKIVDVTARKADYSDISDTFNYDIPFYFESQLSTAIAKINTAINSNKTEGTYGTDIESFIFITDVHWGNNKHHSPGLIKKILESCPIRTVICGGDFVENSNTKPNAVAEIKGFTDAITNIPCYDYFAVCGNHDANTVNQSTVSEQFTKEEEYNLIYAPFANKSNVHWIWDESSAIYSETKLKNDYYIDHARTRTRYLCIDWNHPYGTARQGWIESVLAKNDGYRVVVVYHGIYKVTNGELEPEHTALMTILEPYKSKIVAVISGHAHMDRVVDYYGDGSVPVIITSCDKFSTDAGAVENTVNEQCFDAVVIDYGQSKIEMVRIGRGEDRTVNISLTIEEPVDDRLQKATVEEVAEYFDL